MSDIKHQTEFSVHVAWYWAVTDLELIQCFSTYLCVDFRFSVFPHAPCKEASDRLAQIGQGVLAEGGVVTDAVKKRCPFFYVIDLIMCNCASIKLLALSEDLDWENINVGAEQMTEDNDDDSTYN